MLLTLELATIGFVSSINEDEYDYNNINKIDSEHNKEYVKDDEEENSLNEVQENVDQKRYFNLTNEIINDNNIMQDDDSREYL